MEVPLKANISAEEIIVMTGMAAVVWTFLTAVFGRFETNEMGWVAIPLSWIVAAGVMLTLQRLPS